MDYCTKFFSLMLLISATVATVKSLPLNQVDSTFRHKRDDFFAKLFRRTTEAPTTTTAKLMPNNLEIGKCNDDDKVLRRLRSLFNFQGLEDVINEWEKNREIKSWTKSRPKWRD